MTSKIITLKIKPLSVNNCWQGKRYRTKEYKAYATHADILLNAFYPPEIALDKPFGLSLDFGFSNKTADVDNPVKPIVDILQKKYSFNDKNIYQLEVIKTVVPKGDEFIKILFFNIKNEDIL